MRVCGRHFFQVLEYGNVVTRGLLARGARLVWCCAATGGGAPSLTVSCVHCISYRFNSFSNCIVGQGLGIARKAAVGKTKALPWRGQTLNIIMEQVTYFLKPQLSQLLKWGRTPHGVSCRV